MIQAGEVGAVFKISDEASPVLRRLAQQFDAFDAKIEKVKRSLGTMFDSVKDANAVFGPLLGGIDKLGVASKEAGAVFATAFDGAVDGASARVAALRKEIEGIGRAGSRISGLPSIRYGDGDREIGRIDSLEGFKRALERGGRSSFGVEDLLMGTVGLNPETALAFGAAALGGKAIIEATDLENVRAKMRLGGVSESDVDATTSLAMGLGDKYHVKAATLLDVANDIRVPLGGIAEAREHLETLARARRELDVISPEAGAQLYEAAKSAELDNKITGKGFDDFIAHAVKAAIATGGRVDPRQLYQFEKYARSELQNLNADFLYRYAPGLVQELGGSSAGTALASLAGQVVGGRMATRGLRLAGDLGELDETKVEFDKNGRVVRAKPGAFKYAALLQTDPMAFAERTYGDLQAHGITDETDQEEYLSMMYGNRNAANILRIMHAQKARLDRVATGIDQAKAPAQAQSILNNNPATAMKGAASDFENALAGQTFLNGLTTAVSKGMSDFFQRFRNAPGPTLLDAINPLAPPSPSSPAAQGVKGVIDSIKGTFNIPAPVVNTDVKVTANVTLDGRAIAAAVTTQIVKDNRHVNSTSDFDDRSMFASPETYNF